MSKLTKQRTLSETAAALATKPQPYKLWRMLPAEAFDDARRLEVMGHVGLYMSNIKEWKDAVAGDAACAVKIALNMEIPDEIDYPLDARMTLLLYCALNGSAGAALVLAHLLRKMPLDGPTRNRLATSWLVRNLRIGRRDTVAPLRRRYFARHSIAAQLLGSGEDAS
jgi:hypothetical protein